MATEILWTALPNGRTPARLFLSVHVSPRLSYPGGGEGTLEDFPALHAWPPADLALELQFGVAAPVPAAIVSAPDPTLWPLLFPRTGRVVSKLAAPDYSDTPVHSYPLTKIAQFLKDQYTKVALESPENFPAISTLLANGFDAIGFSGLDGADRWNSFRNQLHAALAYDRVVDTRPESDDTGFDFVQLEDFFAPVARAPEDLEAVFGTPAARKRVTEHRLDFHETVQFVNQHPALLRLLGLVLDVEVDGGAVPLGDSTVSVVPKSAALDGVTNRLPSTHCTTTADRHAARAGALAVHLADGFLRFEDTAQFLPVLVEADGGGLKAVDFAGNLRTKVSRMTEDTPTDSAVPALRADGLSVARLGAAAQLHAKFVLLKGQEDDLAKNSLELHAEDLVRGYRIDVWDSASKAWNSIMERTGWYRVAGRAEIEVKDEGFIGVSATKKPLSDDLYHPEEVFAWDGWSLVAPRPGRTLNTDTAAADPLLDRPPNDPGPDFDARFHFEHRPGSLPSLRYGTSYRFRARTVDLAGNSLPPDPKDVSGHATAAVTYGRFEPPQSPPVLLRTPSGPGESMETVVLRSNFDAAPSPATAERHFVPGKVGQLSVEQYGALDVPHPEDPSKLGLDGAAYAELAARDAATLMNHPDADPRPGRPAGTFVYDVDELSITYTPDPAVRDFAFRLLDGPHQGYLQVFPFRAATGDWFARRAARLVITQGTGAPTFNPKSRVLTVPLEKGDLVHARLSSVLDVGDLFKFGLWGWIVEAKPGNRILSQQLALIQSGQHWMLEPFRILTLVHAVRQPLRRPEFPTGLSADRLLDDTFALVRGDLSFSRKSTSRVDVLASWNEPVDLGPGRGTPVDAGVRGSRLVERQTAFTLKISHDDGQPTELTIANRHEFGDTKHRMVTYRGVATTRYGEFFTTSETFIFAGPGSIATLDTGTPAKGVVPRSVKLIRADGVPLVEGNHYTVDSPAGTVLFANGPPAQMPPAGERITAVYLVPPVTRETSDPPAAPGEFGPQVVDVPSSARPLAPRVLYAIPTFGWDGPTESGGQITSVRRGNGLRIYLERPWWSSGEGELLGVLLWPPAEAAAQPDLEIPLPTLPEPWPVLPPIEDRRRPFVTQWGEDPIILGGALPARYPRLASFPAAAAVATSTGGTPLTLHELGSNTAFPVNVAAHKVVYDADRDLFACDVEVDAGMAYAPFIRLALARYQPSSLGNAHLSRVVLADFVQLAPDRSATVVFADQKSSAMTVTLAGPSHQRTEGTKGWAFPGVAVVIVEQKQPDLEGLRTWAPAGPPVEMTGVVVNGLAQWAAEVTLPGSREPGMWRLVIEQYERLGAEPLTPLANPGFPIPADRLVHTDIIQL